jgi:hypothetical protein
MPNWLTGKAGLERCRMASICSCMSRDWRTSSVHRAPPMHPVDQLHAHRRVIDGPTRVHRCRDFLGRAGVDGVRPVPAPVDEAGVAARHGVVVLGEHDQLPHRLAQPRRQRLQQLGVAQGASRRNRGRPRGCGAPRPSPRPARTSGWRRQSPAATQCRRGVSGVVRNLSAVNVAHRSSSCSNQPSSSQICSNSWAAGPSLAQACAPRLPWSARCRIRRASRPLAR